ncbi:hypothetical protein NE237_024614 [Protea cynaroides]|uniref:Uncharacterized protein n=1 Tax=Protea cynaroides TaxID=273540 RepID=A0A9Q0H3B6_9MAGN|nr:hypothetical protein NE237_024614 [Protea cynaroides]
MIFICHMEWLILITSQFGVGFCSAFLVAERVCGVRMKLKHPLNSRMKWF